VIAGLVMSKQRANRKVQKITPLHPPLNKGGLLLFALCSLMIVCIWFGSASAQGDLKEKAPDLCYKCHIKLKDSFTRSSVHFPFKDGKCNSCHNVHAGNMKGLLKEQINSLCLNCHEGIRNALKKDFVHNALKKGVCTDCHYAHSGDNKHLLVKAQKDLCWDCHNSLKEQLGKSYVHSPFRDGKCSSCHDPHASSEENLARANPNKLCQSCHTAKCKVGNVSITSAIQKLSCDTCHGGHASNTKGLLGPYGHTSFLNRQCDQCHNPIEADKRITLKIPGKGLCLSCHKKDEITLKENDIHINDAKGGCTLCHSYHASKKKNMTVKESQLCFTCHENTEKRTTLMEKALKSIRCVPVKNRKCFECHIPPHSNNPLYFKTDDIQTCAQCHTQQHKITHPIGKDVKDPRNGQPITCVTCHSMHTAKAEFMLSFDRKRQLCIQCHKK
jgi:predicted CXXCH cytochrome family protein